MLIFLACDSFRGKGRCSCCLGARYKDEATFARYWISLVVFHLLFRSNSVFSKLDFFRLQSRCTVIYNLQKAKEMLH